MTTMTTGTTTVSTAAMITLKDETKISELTYKNTIRTIKTLFEENFIVFYDLCEKCKDPKHTFVAYLFDSNSHKTLKNHNLIDNNNRVHDYVRAIVLDSTKGEGLTLQLDPRIYV